MLLAPCSPGAAAPSPTWNPHHTRYRYPGTLILLARCGSDAALAPTSHLSDTPHRHLCTPRTLRCAVLPHRRGAAFGLSAVVKGCGIMAMKGYGIMEALRNAVEDKSAATAREVGGMTPHGFRHDPPLSRVTPHDHYARPP